MNTFGVRNCCEEEISTNKKLQIMKKITTTLKMLFTFVAFTNANAQIINGDFENVKSNFLPSNWGKAFAINEIIDTATGITTSD